MTNGAKSISTRTKKQNLNRSTTQTERKKILRANVYQDFIQTLCGLFCCSLPDCQRHITANLEAAQVIKQRAIDSDLEQLLDETRDKRNQLQQHLTVYQSLLGQLQDAAKTAGKPKYDKDYEEYTELVLDAEQLVVGLNSKMEMIKDRMEFKFKRGTGESKL